MKIMPKRRFHSTDLPDLAKHMILKVLNK